VLFGLLRCELVYLLFWWWFCEVYLRLLLVVVWRLWCLFI